MLSDWRANPWIKLYLALISLVDANEPLEQLMFTASSSATNRFGVSARTHPRLHKERGGLATALLFSSMAPRHFR
jgi:hypothetical protein